MRFSDYGRPTQAQGLGELEIRRPRQIAGNDEIQMSEEELALQIEMYKRLEKEHKVQ